VHSVSIGESNLLLIFIIQLVSSDRVFMGFFGGMTLRPGVRQKIDSDSFDLESGEACGQINGSGDHPERTPRRQDQGDRKYLVE